MGGHSPPRSKTHVDPDTGLVCLFCQSSPLSPASRRAAVRWLWWPCVTLGRACWADQPALALSIRGDGRSSSFPSGFLAPCCACPSRSTWPPVETRIGAARWVQHVDEALGPGSEWKPAVRRWLRAAAESGRSEAEGWLEVIFPVGTRKKLTLTPARFRAQIDAGRRYPGQYYACGRRSWRLLSAE